MICWIKSIECVSFISSIIPSQKYSQYWVEVNHSAAAYDELKMCKSRMQIYDPEIEKVSKKTKLKVSKYEVHTHVD